MAITQGSKRHAWKYLCGCIYLYQYETGSGSLEVISSGDLEEKKKKHRKMLLEVRGEQALRVISAAGRQWAKMGR